MNPILAEIHNFFLFFETLLWVGVYTGLIVVPLIALGYEFQTKRRYPQ